MYIGSPLINVVVRGGRAPPHHWPSVRSEIREIWQSGETQLAAEEAVQQFMTLAADGAERVSLAERWRPARSVIRQLDVDAKTDLRRAAAKPRPHRRRHRDLQHGEASEEGFAARVPVLIVQYRAPWHHRSVRIITRDTAVADTKCFAITTLTWTPTETLIVTAIRLQN